MGVEKLSYSEGMLFIFDKLSTHRFWMKNTIIPLDVIFFDENKNIISIYSMDVEQPKNRFESEKEYEKRLKRYSSIKPCKYALEINYGLSTTFNFKIGDRLNIF